MRYFSHKNNSPRYVETIPDPLYPNHVKTTRNAFISYSWFNKKMSRVAVTMAAWRLANDAIAKMTSGVRIHTQRDHCMFILSIRRHRTALLRLLNAADSTYTRIRRCKPIFTTFHCFPLYTSYICTHTTKWKRRCRWWFKSLRSRTENSSSGSIPATIHYEFKSNVTAFLALSFTKADLFASRRRRILFNTAVVCRDVCCTQTRRQEYVLEHVHLNLAK